MSRHRQIQKLWQRLTDLQRQYVIQLVRHHQEGAADTQKEMTKVRADIMKLEKRDERDKQRAAA